MLMFKKKGIGKKIAGFALAASMVITLIPQMEYTAQGVTVTGYPVYNEIIFDTIKDKITDTAYTSRATVYGGIGPWFDWFSKDRVGMTHVYHNCYFISSRVNLRPSVSVISADGNDYKAVFNARKIRTWKITENPDVSLRFGATFMSTKKKPSLTLDGVTLGGSSLSKKSTKTLEGTATYPFEDDLNVTVQGASGTEVSNMWIAAIDNTTAKYNDISARLDSNGLYLNIQMDEELRWANSHADQYMDDMYIEIKLLDSLTNIESATLKAGFHELKGDTLTFLCTRSEMGEFYEKEFQLTRISKVNIPVISQIDFPVYGVKGCYDYQISYDKYTKTTKYETIGNAITYLQDVKLDTTPITDLAGNKVELGTINLLGKNLCFDNVKPWIDEITFTDSNGMSRDAAKEQAGKEESSWPEDIKREELFLGDKQGIIMSLLTSEPLDISNIQAKAKLNVLDENGKQVELQVSSIASREAGTYAERGRTQLVFETFTAKKGMQMMAGYEGKPIQIIGLSGKIVDKRGNSLESTIPAPDKQIYLDVTAPEIMVEKLATEDNGRNLEFLVSIGDKAGEELSAGILGKEAKMKLTATSLTQLNYRYTVLSSDGKEIASGTGSTSGETPGVIAWKMHAVNNYAVTVKVQFTNSEKITVDEIQAQVSASDIVNNENSGTKEAHPFVVDEVAPVIMIEPIEYTSTSESTMVKVPIGVSDYSEVASIQYQWTDINVTTPDENAWTAFSFTAGKNAQVNASYDFSNSSQMKLWVKAGDNKGNFVQTSTPVIVEIDRPMIYYNDTAILLEPDEKPVLTVVGPAKKSATATQNAGADGYTRVTIIMGDATYVRLVKTGESINVFDFTGTWYKVSLNDSNTGYSSVEQLSDNSVLKSYYGEVSVSFDAAYTDLTPIAGDSFVARVNDSSYVKDTANIKVLYASVNEVPASVHKVTFGTVKDGTGETVLAENGNSGNTTISLKQIDGEASIIAGTQFEFSLSNLLIADWDIKDIDFTKSYVALKHTRGTESTVIDTRLLETAINQTYNMPEDIDYESGLYTVTVYVYQKGASVAAEYSSLNIVLDATKVKNAGLWEYKIGSQYYWPDHDIVHKGDFAPLESVGLSISDMKETYRDNVFAYYTAGASNVALSLRSEEAIETYDGVTIGEVVGFRVWNSLSGITEDVLAVDNFIKTESDQEGYAERFYYLGIELYDKETIGETGFVTSGYDLPVVSGANTFYYQVKLANGTVSEIKQFTIMVSDITPNMELSIDSYVESLKKSDIEGQMAVSSLTMKLDSAFSMNGNGKVNVYLYKYGNADITREGVTTEVDPVSEVEGVALQLNDLITFNDDDDNTYSNNYAPDSGVTNRTNTAFIVYDEFGGAMAICPQIGSERRIGHTGNSTYYNANYVHYDYDGILNNTVVFHEPVLDEESGKILYYETRNLETGEVLEINYENLEYNKFVIHGTEWKIAPYNYSSWVNKGAYVESYLSFRDDDMYSSKEYLPELVDYESITFTFFREENGENVDYITVPLVENYAEPNEAGYMGAKVNEYTGNITVYIANQVNQTPSKNYTNYKVNYKDIFGNAYTTSAGYGLYKVDSSVASEEMTDSGIVLYTNAAIAGGITAQYRNSYAGKGYGFIETGVFANGTYIGSFTDAFGIEHQVQHEITEGWDFGVNAVFSTVAPTLGEVTVLLTNTDGLAITVQEADGMQILSNATSAVKVTVSQNKTFTFTVENSEEVHSITVDNIVEFHPTIQWNYDESQILTDEKGVKYLNGSVTAYVIDKELDVWDSYTGLVPSYTFYPGEETSYTFDGDDYYAELGNETIAGIDLRVKLPVELRNESFEVEDPEIPVADADAPAVQIRAYAQRNGIFKNENLALQVEPGIYGTALKDYEGDSILECFEDRADTTEFLGEIGWASGYRFQIEVLDDSNVKLFVKRGFYSGAPDYVAGGSDTIDGVSLSGRVLEITDIAEFTLFAVDEEGNATAIPFDITNIGEAPLPQIKKVYTGTNAYVYVLPPNVSGDAEISDFELTAPNGAEIKTETEADSEYLGNSYITYTKNGTYLINYSFNYKKNQNVSSENIVGQLEVVVDEIDDVQIFSKSIKWSANKEKIATSQDVTVQLTYNKDVKEVIVPYGYENAVNVLIMGNRVTVRYVENFDKILPLTAVSYNDTQITLNLDAVTNIDKVAPIVTSTNLALAENGKSVTVTFVTDEDALFCEENAYGTKEENGYVHDIKVTENGTYTYSFVDKAGNITQVTIEVSQIVDSALELWFNTTATDEGAVKDPTDIKLNVGDSIYVKANRDCSVSLNGGEEKAFTAGTWTALMITDNEAGLWPIVYAVDDYGNTASVLLNGVKPLDKDAPVITAKKDQIIAKVGMDRAVILDMLAENITVNDVDEDVEVNIQFTEDLTVEGVTTVTYTATDSSNNTSTKTIWLKLTSQGEPEVKVDGEVVGRDSVYLGSLTDDLNLTVDTDGEPYSVVYKKGVFTTAQMKIGSTTLVRDAESVMNVELPLEESGYYTICIRTQSHDEYLFIIYVE